MKKNKKMIATISAVALAMATAGCNAPENNYEEESETKVIGGGSDLNETPNYPVDMDCENLELVQGNAYSGDEDEVWYCNDDNDDNHGSFFYPFIAGYVTSNYLNSKHKIDVSKYKPGSSKRIVNGKTYNKFSKTPITSAKPNSKTSKSTTSSGLTSKSKPFTSKPGSSSVRSGMSSSSSSKSSGSFSSGSSSKGFGSSGFSSGG